MLKFIGSLLTAFVLFLLVLLVVLVLIGFWLIHRARTMLNQANKGARQQSGQTTASGQNNAETGQQTQRTMFNDDEGEYVEFEEIKDETGTAGPP